MEKVATFAILGDSAASGVGDSDKYGVTKGWGYYLAKHFQDPLVYINLSRPGAQSAEVLEDQLPKALVFKPDIAAVIVGGNDAGKLNHAGVIQAQFGPGSDLFGAGR